MPLFTLNLLDGVSFRSVKLTLKDINRVNKSAVFIMHRKEIRLFVGREKNIDCCSVFIESMKAKSVRLHITPLNDSRLTIKHFRKPKKKGRVRVDKTGIIADVLAMIEKLKSLAEMGGFLYI